MAEKTGVQVKQSRLAGVFQFIGDAVKVAAVFFSICAFMLGMAVRFFNLLRMLFAGIFKGTELHKNDEPSGKTEENSHGT